MSAFFGAAALVAVFVHAHPVTGDGPLSLEAAIRQAELASTSVKLARSDYDAARAVAGQDQSRRLPQVGIQGSATVFDNRTTVTFPGSATSFQLEPNNQEQLSVVLSQDLDVSGQL